MLCKRTPIEETVAAMVPYCARRSDAELRALRFSFDDKAVALRQSRWYRVCSALPWDTSVEWRMREILALRSAVTQALVDRMDLALSIDEVLGGTTV